MDEPVILVNRVSRIIPEPVKDEEDRMRQIAKELINYSQKFPSVIYKDGDYV